MTYVITKAIRRVHLDHEMLTEDQSRTKVTVLINPMPRSSSLNSGTHAAPRIMLLLNAGDHEV